MDEYAAAFAESVRERLDELRRLARAAVPEATETLKWGNPAYVYPDGVILYVISAHANHVNFTVTPSTRAAFDAELTGWRTGKGSVQISYTRDVPADFLRRMIAYRVRELTQDGVLWR